MIKYLYFIVSFIIVVTVVEGIPVIDIFSAGWHSISKYILMGGAVLSFFGTVLLLVAYMEEHEDPESDLGQIFLRMVVGLKFLPKWPIAIWLVLSGLLVQFNQVGLAITVAMLSALASTIVFIQNGFYTSFLKSSLKGK